MSRMTTTSRPAPSRPELRLRAEDVVRREAPALLAYLSRRVAEPADAADLLGDVLVVVWRRVEAMPAEPEAARMWMFGIARKVLSGSHRGARRRLALADHLRHELTVAGVAAGADGEVPAGPADARADLLAAALDQLRPADREIIRLVHWDSFTLAEVAGHLRLRPATARSRYHRARNRLKHLLEGVLQP